MITDLATGKVLGPYVSSTTSPGWTTGAADGHGRNDEHHLAPFPAGH